MIGEIILLIINLIAAIVGSVEFYKYQKEVDNWKERPPIDVQFDALMWGWMTGMLMITGSAGTLTSIFLIIF